MIVHMLDLSTAHITQQTGLWLDTTGLDSGSPVVGYEKKEYGWLISVPSEWEEGQAERIPGDLLAVMTYARAKRCAWIMFDRDADEVLKLPTYEW